MAKETFIASFAKDVIEASVFSEADAVVYQFKIGGATNYSTAPYLKRNDEDLTGTTLKGLNLRGFKTANGIPEIKSFELTPTDSTMNTGFTSYMNSSGNPYVIIMSGPGLKSSPSVDTWFKSVGSVNWPGTFLANNYSCGYVGIYNSARKKIVSEVLLSTDGTDKNLAELSVVFDELNDIGAVGMPSRIVYDTEEYATMNGYEYKRFPTNNAINKMSDYGLLPGAVVELSADLYADAVMTSSNMKTRVNLRWYNASNALVDSSTILESNGTGWTSIGKYSTAPAAATGFTVVVSRFPRNDAVTGKSSIKNIVLTETSRDGSKKNGNAIIGIHGIKAGRFVEQQTANHLMDLGIFTTSETNTVPIVGIRENNGTFVSEEIDFTIDQKLPTFLLFKRNSSGSYHSDGLSMNMYEVGPNIPRFDTGYDTTTRKAYNRGLLVEKRATNLLVNSNFDVLDPVPWGSTKPFTTTRNANGTIKVAVNTSSRLDFQNHPTLRKLNLAANVDYTTSHYLNGNYPNSYMYWLNPNGAGALYLGTIGDITPLATTNALISRTFTTRRLTTPLANGDLMRGYNANEVTDGWYNVGYSQVEAGSYPTSWIRTLEEPATREPDILILNVDNYTGSVLLEYERQDNNKIEKKWVDLTNAKQPELSSYLDVGVWMRSVKMCKYILSDAQKQVFTG
jgi:hypothetical protein